MLTIIDNIKRFNRRYNRRRGSAMLMVLMTMAIIIVVGTSMLFITLSSFSTSIANTQQARAYNAALTVSESIKSTIESIVSDKESEIIAAGQDGYLLNFTTTDNFSENIETVDYIMLNGAKVQVSIVGIARNTNMLSSAIVDVRSEYRQQTSSVSFTIDKEVVEKNYTLEETYGNAFVITNNMSNQSNPENKNDNLILKRIEGDMSIDCYDEEIVDGETVKVMKTRYFNPTVLTGITGSVYANGDLIIGSVDNAVRIHGNLYVDGNLTIRGLDLGINVPAIFKKTYQSKYADYMTIANMEIAGIEVMGTGDLEIRTPKTAKIGEAMYGMVNGVCVPLQVYDDVSHYTMLDKGYKSFYTKEYDKNGNVVQEIDEDGKLHDKISLITIGDEPNMDYFGAVMYTSIDCNEMYQMYPEGGNIYCSGDIIIDRCNTGNLEWKINITPESYKQINKEGTAAEPVKNQSVIRGDVFCLGRMIVAPSLSDGAAVFNSSLLLNTKAVTTGLYGDNGKFYDKVKNIFGTKKILGAFNIANYSRLLVEEKYNALEVKIYRYVSPYGDGAHINDFVDSFQDAVEASIKKGGSAYNALKQAVDAAIVGNTQLYTDINNQNANRQGNLPQGDGSSTSNSGMRNVLFSDTSSIYIYNYKTIDDQIPLRKYNDSVGTHTVEYNGKPIQVINGIKYYADDGSSKIGDVYYSSGLTVKNAQLNLQEVFVNGDIEVVGINNAYGFNYNSSLTAKTIAAAGNAVSSEFREITLRDIVKNNNPDKTDEEIEEILKERYWGFDDEKTIFEGNAELNFSIKDLYSPKYPIIVIGYKNVSIETQKYKKLKTEGLQKIWEYDSSSFEHQILINYFYDCNNSVFKNSKNDEISEENIKNILSANYFKKPLYTDLSPEQKNSIDRLIIAVKTNKFKASDCAYIEIVEETDTPTTTPEYIYTNLIATSPDNEIRKTKEYFLHIRSDMSEGDYDKKDFYLDYSDVSVYNDITMLALISNHATALNGIVVNSDSGLEITNRYSANVLTGDKANIIDKFNGTPFYDKHYGMYLRDTLLVFDSTVNRIDYEGNYISTIEEVFKEMNCEHFAKINVGKMNGLTESTMREFINKAKENPDKEEYDKYRVTEYNDFEIISGTSTSKSNEEKTSNNPFAVNYQNHPDNPLYETKLDLENTDPTVNGHKLSDPNFFTQPAGFFDNGPVLLTTKKGYTCYAWCYTKSTIGNYHAISDKRDTKANSVRVLRFFNTDTGEWMTCDSSFSIDPYNDEKFSSERTMVDYTFNKNIYFNWGGEGGKGYDTEDKGAVVFGADFVNPSNMLGAKRMNIVLDTTEHDVYIYINAPSTEVNSENNNKSTSGLLNKKVTWTVKGSHNAYIMLIGDTCIDGNAFSSEVVGYSNGDISDTAVGTHFISDEYPVYKSGFQVNDWAILDIDKFKVCATFTGEMIKSGTLFIIGTGDNRLLLGRGSYVNGFVYLPNGSFVTRSRGIFDIFTLGTTSSNPATIVAGDISIEGSNAGQLTFTAYDVSTTGGTGGSTINLDFVDSDTIRTYKWSIGNYYYG